MVKLEMKRILRKKYGNVCFFCGKPEEYFKYKLSLFHILPVGRYPKLELELENVVLACWGDFPYKCCHNLWEDRVQPQRQRMEEKLLLVKGAEYLTALKIQDKILPKLNEQRAMFLLEYYKNL
jgi:hypothetical protein